jgi:hypothetical protein
LGGLLYLVVNKEKNNFKPQFGRGSHCNYLTVSLSIVKKFYSKGLTPQYDFPNLPRLNGPTEFNGAGGASGASKARKEKQ